MKGSPLSDLQHIDGTVQVKRTVFNEVDYLVANLVITQFNAMLSICANWLVTKFVTK